MATAMASPQTVRRLRYMFGVVTQVELNSFLEVFSIDSESRKREIKTRWAEAADLFEKLRCTEEGEPEAIVARQLDQSADRRIAELTSDPLFMSTFSSYRISFEEVEISRLVACQRTVHIEHVERLKLNFENGRGDLFSFCLKPPQDTTPVIVGRAGANAFTASSENPGLRFLGAYEQPYRPGLLDVQVPGGQPLRAVIQVLGYGGSTANAYRIGRRMILNNGFHRLYALGQLGVQSVPIVVQEITRPKLELPPQIGELPRDYLIEEPRPALMKDFFDEKLTCEVTQRGFTKALQVAWGVNEGIVPR